jgi:hypothetical protein
MYVISPEKVECAEPKEANTLLCPICGSSLSDCECDNDENDLEWTKEGKTIKRRSGSTSSHPKPS